jgi:hypothetical protein
MEHRLQRGTDQGGHHCTVQRGKVIRSLSKEIDIDAEEDHAFMPLLLAAKAGHGAVVEILVLHQANINPKGRKCTQGRISDTS